MSGFPSHQIRRPTVRGLVLAAFAMALLGSCGAEDSADAPATSGISVPVSPVVQNLAPEEGAALIEQLGATANVIDVRTPSEFAEGHLENATNLDIEGGAFTSAISSLSKEAPYIVYCRSGRRSAMAAQAMIDAGFTDVYDLGGILDWVGAGLPVVTG